MIDSSVLFVIFPISMFIGVFCYFLGQSVMAKKLSPKYFKLQRQISSGNNLLIPANEMIYTYWQIDQDQERKQMLADWIQLYSEHLVEIKKGGYMIKSCHF